MDIELPLTKPLGDPTGLFEVKANTGHIISCNKLKQKIHTSIVQLAEKVVQYHHIELQKSTSTLHCFIKCILADQANSLFMRK